MQRAGKPTPLDDQPEIDWETNQYITAFNRLSKSRPIGMDAGYLVLSEIGYYWEVIDRIGSRLGFIDIIQSLDQSYKQYISQKKDG